MRGKIRLLKVEHPKLEGHHDAEQGQKLKICPVKI